MNMKRIALLLFLALCAAQLFAQQTGSHFPTRDRGWWTFGIDGGLAYQSSDVRTQFNGWGAGLTLGKNLLYRPGGMFSFDLRGRGLFTRSYGADAGQIHFEGEGGPLDLAQATPHQMLAQRRRAIAYVSQFLRTVPRVPALDVVAERSLQAHPMPAGGEPDDELQHAEALEAARDAARELLRRLNLPSALWSLPPATFSGGEQQRINIARGFVEPARLLLLDEPTASLDAANRRVVVQLIEEAKARGTAVVGIFHDEEVRDAVATRCVELGMPSDR